MRCGNVQKRINDNQFADRNYLRRSGCILTKIIFTCCLAALLAICSSVVLAKAISNKPEEAVYYKYYNQIEVKAGDSLWKIAGEYMEHGPYETRNDYIEEVIALNQLPSNVIYADQHLIIPYYDDTYK